MRFGVCCGEERFGTAAEMGYDYVETVFSKFTTMTDGEYARLLSELRKYNLKSEACNCFFPSEMKLVGETADFSQIDSYVKKRYGACSGGRLQSRCYRKRRSQKNTGKLRP